MTSLPLRSFKTFTLTIPGFCGLGLLLSAGLAFADFSESTVEKAKESTVRIFTLTAEGGGSGSGFVINRQGHVVTNYHVISGAVKVAVAYGNGDTVIMKEARVIVSEPGKDLAILKCDSLPKTRPITLVDRRTSSGQAVMAIGFPGILDDLIAADGESLRKTGSPDEYSVSEEDAAGFTPVTFPGNAGKEMPIDSGFGGSFKAIAHSAKISEGNSGGPLIDRDGRLAGINVAGAGTKMGVDYAFAIHASELIALARAHSIPIDVTSSRASSAGSLSGIHLLLYVVLAAFAVVMFLMVLRKPRAVMVDAMSRVIRSTKHDHPPHSPRKAHRPAEAQGGHARQSVPAGAHGSMRLRGRDLQGLSFDVAFSGADFRRHGGRLVIGRNNELSQLVISHDSVSRQHATLSLNGSSIQVEDRNSGNGTKVNDREIPVGAAPVPLNPGDKLTLGEVDLIFEVFH
jgi:hypothetical protein